MTPRQMPLRVLVVLVVVGLLTFFAFKSSESWWAISDPILTIHSDSLTTYLPSATSRVQDVRPLVTQRGVNVDGSLNAPSTFPFALAGNPFEPQWGTSETMLRESTGTYAPLEIDLALPARGFPWVIGRTYNTRQVVSGSHYVSDGYQGKNWFQTSQPELVFYDNADNSKDLVYLVYGADRFIEFKRFSSTSNTFKATNGAAGIVQFTAGSPDLWSYFDQSGFEAIFFGEDATSPNDASWQLWKIVDQDGNNAYVGDALSMSTAISNGYESDGRVKVAYDTSGRRYTYSYTSGRLTSVKAEVYGTSWTEVGRVDYAYHSGSDNYGSAGDLMRVDIVHSLTESAVASIRSKYYRYLKTTYPSAIELVLGFEGARNYDYETDGTATFDHGYEGDTSTDLKPYAEVYFSYNSSYQVATAFFQGECGCSGALNGEVKFSYSTNGSHPGGAGYDEEWSTRTIIERPVIGTSEAFMTLYFDEVAQPLGNLLTDDSPSQTNPQPGFWATDLVRSSAGLVTELHTPENVTGYTHSTGAFTYSTSAGLVVLLDRISASNATKGFAEFQRHRTGTTSGDAHYDAAWVYTTQGLAIGDDYVVRPLIQYSRQYETETTSSTGYSITHENAYTFYSSDIAVREIESKDPIITTGRNGAGGATPNSWKQYFEHGQVRWEKSPTARITYHQYDSFGLETKSIEDANTTLTGSGQDFYQITPPTGYASSGTPLHLKTTRTFDPQGRLVTEKLPSNQEALWYHSRLVDQRLVMLRYADNDPPRSPNPAVYYGPVEYVVANLAGRPEWSATLGLTGNSTTTALSSHIDESSDDPILAPGIGSSMNFAKGMVYSKPGTELTESRAYFDVPSIWPGDASNYDPTKYAYDERGRRMRIKEPTGTIYRTEFDLRNQKTDEWVGTNDSSFPGGEAGTDNMVAVAYFEYDGGATGKNGNLTEETRYVVDGTTLERVTGFSYDVRGRLLLVSPPVPPYLFSEYDNLGRRTAVGAYSAATSINLSTDKPSIETTNRLALSETAYDELSRVYRTTRHAIASNGTSEDTLLADSWYDSEGRLAKVDGEELAKYAYDRVGRQARKFLLAKHNDTVYSDALTVTGDHILEEYETVYATDADEVVMEVTLRRFHNLGTGTDATLDTDTTEMTIPADTSLNGRADITAHWYDRFSRRTDTVRYGDNGGVSFNRSGLSVPATSDTKLRSIFTYNPAGLVETVTDPKGYVEKRTYDEAGRLSKHVSNFLSAGTPTLPDENKTWIYAYDDGLRTTVTLDVPAGSTDQVTAYDYGTVGGGAAGNSEIATGHLLQKITYPDSGSSSDVVTFAYNAQSELIWRKDQAGNIIDRDMNLAGRLEHVRYTTPASGFDIAVRRITRVYDSLGRVANVRQYDSATVGSGSVLNDVQSTWNSWGLLAKSEQDHNSAVGGTLLYDVDYTWAKAASVGMNTIRVTGLVLPSGAEVAYGYLTTGNHLFDADASRVSRVSVKRGGTEVTAAEYEYLGLDMVVETDYPEPDVESQFYDDSAPTSYGLLDNFNRVKTWFWRRYAPATPPIFYDVDYTYDRNSHVTSIVDNVHVNSSVGVFDTTVTVDRLDRVSQFDSDRMYFAFGLDHPGNWVDYDRDLGTDGNFCDDQFDLDEKRDFNAANELTRRDSYCLGIGDIEPTWDAVGNLLADGEGLEFKYDAFYRLVTITDAIATEDRALLRYDGRSRLIGIRIDEDEDGLDTTDAWRRLVYDASTRVVAIYLDNTDFPAAEYVWNQDGSASAISSERLVLLRDQDDNADEDFADAGERIYYANGLEGVVVTLGASGEWHGSMAYGAMGEVYYRPACDANSDGACNGADLGILGGDYDVREDYNLDGSVDVSSPGVDYDYLADTSHYHTLGYGTLPGGLSIGYLGMIGFPVAGESWWVRPGDTSLSTSGSDPDADYEGEPLPSSFGAITSVDAWIAACLRLPPMSPQFIDCLCDRLDTLTGGMVPQGGDLRALCAVARAATDLNDLKNIFRRWQRPDGTIDIDKATLEANTVRKQLNARNKYVKQLKEHGKKSLENSRKNLRKRLEEHREKLEKIRKAKGKTGPVEREIENFERELEEIDKLIGAGGTSASG